MSSEIKHPTSLKNTTYSRPSAASGANSRAFGEGKKVLVLISGGMDSSVTAALLKTQGYDVYGLHLQLWDPQDPIPGQLGGRCCNRIDAHEARKVCEKIDIPFYTIDAHEAFAERVIDHLVHESLQGRIGAPCGQCNLEIKFRYLIKKADELGCSLIATGHYAQVVQDPSTGEAHLLKATDIQRDQSYFLYGLPQSILRRALMPLGGFPRSMVKKLAEEYGLTSAAPAPLAPGAEPNELCFVESPAFTQLVESRSNMMLRPSGVLRSLDEQVVGEHTGIFRCMVGQPQGLMITNKVAENFVVLGFESRTHTVIVGKESDLYLRELVATRVSWVRPPAGMKGLRCRARIHARHDEADCRVTIFENGTVHVEFDQPQRAITPGQAVVFYSENEILGGGIIDHSTRS